MTQISVYYTWQISVHS